ISTLLAICDPGDEVIVLEPFYENYGPDAAISGATPVFVPLRPPSFGFDPDELARAFTSRTKAIIVNTPNNPTGRVFTRTELETIAVALELRPVYYVRLATEYRSRRDHLMRLLGAAGFSPNTPEGAYYVLCDIRPFGFKDDVAFANWLVTEVGVAGVPGSSFFSRPELGRDLIRYTFCKTADLLEDAGAR